MVFESSVGVEWTDIAVKTLSSKQYNIQYYTYCYKNYIDDILDDNVRYNFFSSSETIGPAIEKFLLFNFLHISSKLLFNNLASGFNIKT